jgi:hypothetical protein
MKITLKGKHICKGKNKGKKFAYGVNIGILREREKFRFAVGKVIWFSDHCIDPCLAYILHSFSIDMYAAPPSCWQYLWKGSRLPINHPQRARLEGPAVIVHFLEASPCLITAASLITRNFPVLPAFFHLPPPGTPCSACPPPTKRPLEAFFHPNLPPRPFSTCPPPKIKAQNQALFQMSCQH